MGVHRRKSPIMERQDNRQPLPDMTADIYQPLTRIALFYDGTYFMNASQYFS